MFGLTDFVIVIVVNNLLADSKRPTTYFQSGNIRVAANNAIRDTLGNPHARSDIQKQAYHYLDVPDIKAAFGLTGTNFMTHTAYRGNLALAPDDAVNRKDQIVIIRDDLDLNVAIQAANRFKILPERTCR